MSELTNRAAYIKGLADGMKLDKETTEGRLLDEIINLLSETTAELDSIDQEQGFIADKIDELEEEVDVIGNEVFDDYADYDDEDEFQITCENCGEEIIVTEDDLDEGEVVCPNCGEIIEFDFDCDCEGCDGDCDSCDD